jgi:hypothetical protein
MRAAYAAAIDAVLSQLVAAAPDAAGSSSATGSVAATTTLSGEAIDFLLVLGRPGGTGPDVTIDG